MTPTKRKDNIKKLSWALAALLAIVVLLRMNKKSKMPIVPPTPMWEKVENVAFFIGAMVAAALLVMAAGLIPFASPVLLAAAGLLVIYTLYITIISRGSSMWLDKGTGNEATEQQIRTGAGTVTKGTYRTESKLGQTFVPGRGFLMV